MQNASNDDKTNSPRRDKPAIVLVASGTSDPRGIEVFSHVDDKVGSRYAGHQVLWAFTGRFVLAKLKKLGTKVAGGDAASVDEVVERLKREGCRRAVLQSLHVAPGGDCDRLAAVDTGPMRTTVGDSLLSDDRSINAVVDAIEDEVRPDAFNVVVCHGSRKNPAVGRQLAAFADNAEDAYKNLVVCSLIGQPGSGKLAEAKRRDSNLSRVHFIPLMLTAGLHMQDDVLGDKPESWKNILSAAETTHARPLGYNRKVLDVYLAHLDAALAELGIDR